MTRKGAVRVSREVLIVSSGVLPIVALLGFTVYVRWKRPAHFGLLIAGGIITLAGVLSMVGMQLAGRIPDFRPFAVYGVAVYLVGGVCVVIDAVIRARVGVGRDA